MTMNMRSLIPWGRSTNQQAPTQYRSNEQDPLLSLQRDMNRLFDDVFRSFDSRLPSMGALGSFGSFGAPWPSVEITDTDKEIRVTAEMPGLEEKDIEVLLDGDVLTLRGEDLGYKVLPAANGQEALGLLDAGHTVDLLFTDVVLPGGLDGRRLADEAQARRPGLKVLYTTGYTRNAIVHNGRLDAGVDLISKPFTSEALALKVRAMLDR
jgi:CheY-like chemotaxis protein